MVGWYAPVGVVVEATIGWKGASAMVRMRLVGTLATKVLSGMFRHARRQSLPPGVSSLLFSFVRDFTTGFWALILCEKFGSPRRKPLFHLQQPCLTEEIHARQGGIARAVGVVIALHTIAIAAGNFASPLHG